MKIILNMLTYGKERIGLRVAREIKKLNIGNDILSFQIANRRAFELAKRSVDQDLNRSFPGREDGNHEERIAYELSPAIRSADIVIDIHSTKSELKDAVIVTKFDGPTRKCIEAIQPKYVLIMSATKDNALISQAKIGIAFEYGKDNDPAVLKKMVADIERLFGHLGLIKNNICRKKTVTKYFDVFSRADKPKGYKLLKKIKNYKLVRKGETFARKGGDLLVAEEDFYPIIFGEKNYEDYFGFKGKRIF
ncbi:MAG: succinylglutamate desuccinylase/aspartoacylase family protein [Candidatus Paceibacterota bacterium]|jgi:predicted deacylase